MASFGFFKRVSSIVRNIGREIGLCDNPVPWPAGLAEALSKNGTLVSWQGRTRCAAWAPPFDKEPIYYGISDDEKPRFRKRLEEARLQSLFEL